MGRFLNIFWYLHNSYKLTNMINIINLINMSHKVSHSPYKYSLLTDLTLYKYFQGKKKHIVSYVKCDFKYSYHMRYK